MDLKIKNKQAIFTVEFQIYCVKCGKEFESIAVKKRTAPIKHTAKCPNCNTKHLWNAN
jgi:DNA-directed RNA polymerase subunit RPC12/RpoP